ncbi:NAD(P)-binding protein [Microvirga tunisiensis]|uniref:FAD-binding protein n=1 Tax=Microvirga tunisiensis TaxID=2108360 RepID=A0A5N7MUX8_9HYPH|nr:NAD(P)-binding protein [Microvirga tunisiensis]MPR12758.1 FAD-binding protein [Microvirga tunisiensis]MPR30480.1 FAD-binding protein [Microvirga tunisiensis]
MRVDVDSKKGTHVVSDFDVIVLGAGITGLVSASVLSEQGYKRILVIDEYNHIGGNHIDCTFAEYTFDVGSFIFQDDSPLLRHFPELLPLYVPINPTFGRLNPQGLVTRYPISIKDDLLSAGPIELFRILTSVAFARLFRHQLNDARSFAQFWIGARLLKRSGLENYIERFHGVPAGRIDISFAEKRMGWIKEYASLTTYLRKWLKPSVKAPTNQQLARPREGFAHLYRAAAQRLESRGVHFLLGEVMQSLVKEDRTFHLRAGSQRFVASRVVSTIPIERVQGLCGMPRDRGLQTVTLISLFFSFSGKRGFSQSILFNFSHKGAWKRLTMHSDFYGRSCGREFFSVEVIADHVHGSVTAAEQDFRQHTSANGLFVGDLKLEGSHTLANAYPIYTDQADQKATKAVAALNAFGVESFGRQGGFNYQPTARVSTLEAESALRRG